MLQALRVAYSTVGYWSGNFDNAKLLPKVACEGGIMDFEIDVKQYYGTSKLHKLFREVAKLQSLQCRRYSNTP
jgi:hypothetical protein